MKRLLLLALFIVFAAMVHAQTAVTPAEQLRQGVAKLQSGDNVFLRGDLIDLALKMDPKPAVPDDVERYMARGNAAMKDAHSPKDYYDAAVEFNKATLAAPWVANPYYNLGIALGKVGDAWGARESLKLYLRAAPDATDAAKAKKLMFEMEYLDEKMRKPRHFVISSAERNPPQTRSEYETVEASFEGDARLGGGDGVSLIHKTDNWEIKITKATITEKSSGITRLIGMGVYVSEATGTGTGFRTAYMGYDESMALNGTMTNGKTFFLSSPQLTFVDLPVWTDLSKHTLGISIKYTCGDAAQSPRCGMFINGKVGILAQ